MAPLRRKNVLTVSQLPRSGRRSRSQLKMCARPTIKPMNRTSETGRKAAAASASRMTTPDQCPLASFWVAANTTMPCASAVQNMKLKCHDCQARAVSPLMNDHRNAAPPSTASATPTSLNVRAGKRRALSTSSARDTLTAVIAVPWGSWPRPATCARNSPGPTDRRHAPCHRTPASAPAPSPARTFRLVGVALAVLGGAAFLWSFINGETARAWQSWHFNFMFWTALAQGMVVFAATQKLAKGHWSGVVIRLAEAAAAFLPVSLVLFIGLIVGRAHIFSWLRDLRPDLGSWLTVKTFFLRNGAIYVLLTWLSWRFVRRDLAPDVRELADGRPAERLADRDAISRDAAVLVVAYAF